jgi:hypothetical protein
MTQSSGLLSTRRRTSQLPAIAKDRANDERAGPRPRRSACTSALSARTR